jgi:hypothetical protein
MHSHRIMIGLFGLVAASGKIKNLGVDNVNIQGRDHVGGLCGYNESGEILSSYVTGSVTGEYNCVGGLCGGNNGTISQSYAIPTGSGVTGSAQVGGLCGQNYSGIISQSYAEGTVTSVYDYVGGLCGYNESGTISKSYAAGVTMGGLYVGGLCGQNNSIISQCYSTSAVTGQWECVGSLCGQNSGSISASYATGSVTGNFYVGGLCGINYGEINRSYAAGAVTGSAPVGGLCGQNNSDSGTLIDCFWDTDISNQSDGVGDGSSDGVTGKSTSEMKILSTFTDAGWDFVGETANGTEDIWAMPSDSYPVLFWQANLPVETPAFSPDGGAYRTGQTVTITCGTVGAAIHYTTNGVDPTESDLIIASGDTVSVSVNPATTLKAAAFVDGKTPSAVKSATYSILYYSGGDGSADNPFKIATKADLLELAVTTTDYNKCFILTADIDLAGETFNTAVIAPDTDNTEWNYFQGTPFTGIFDGNGKKISNLTITGLGHDYLGLFGQVETNGQIKNLGVNVTLIGRHYVGGLVGYNKGTITSCYTTGAVSGTNFPIGGLVGHNVGTITSCYATGTVSGEFWYVGGLVGYNVGTINSCYATGTVSGTAQYVGGLVGQNYRGGNVICCYSTGKPTGNYNVGGLAGTGGGNFVACFWDKETSEIATSAGGANVQGKTSTEMKTLSTYTTAGWDFVGETANGTAVIWKMRCEGMNYPKLTWQQSPAADWVCPDGVAMEDFAYLAARWMRTDCAATDNCEDADLNRSGDVEMNDLIAFAALWLEGI